MIGAVIKLIAYFDSSTPINAPPNIAYSELIILFRSSDKCSKNVICPPGSCPRFMMDIGVVSGRLLFVMRGRGFRRCYAFLRRVPVIRTIAGGISATSLFYASRFITSSFITSCFITSCFFAPSSLRATASATGRITGPSVKGFSSENVSGISFHPRQPMEPAAHKEESSRSVHSPRSSRPLSPPSTHPPPASAIPHSRACLSKSRISSSNALLKSVEAFRNSAINLPRPSAPAPAASGSKHHQHHQKNHDHVRNTQHIALVLASVAANLHSVPGFSSLRRGAARYAPSSQHRNSRLPSWVPLLRCSEGRVREPCGFSPGLSLMSFFKIFSRALFLLHLQGAYL